MKKLFSPAPLFRKGTPLFLRALHAVRLAVTFFVVSTVGIVLLYRFVPPPATPLMLLRLIDQQRDGDPVKLAKDWRPLERISPHLAAAAVASEDQRFYDHNGFDFEAIRKARLRNERASARGSTRVAGASTISQQTTKNLFLWPARSWTRKGLEVWFTVLIETLWPKRRILEMYLNVAEFGNGVYGAQAAARHWYGRDAARLTRAQAASLAAILPKPRAWSPVNPSRRVARRQAWILRQLRWEAAHPKGSPLTPPPPPPPEILEDRFEADAPEPLDAEDTAPIPSETPEPAPEVEEAPPTPP